MKPVLFAGTTFYNQKALFRKPESVAQAFDELIFDPEVGMKSAGNDDVYGYFNTGDGRTAGDTKIQTMLKQHQIPAFYTETGMDVYSSIDNYVATHRAKLEVVG